MFKAMTVVRPPDDSAQELEDLLIFRMYELAFGDGH